MVHRMTKILEWDAYEYHHAEKSRGWFIALAVAAVAGTALAIMAENYLFAFIVVLTGVLIGFFAVREPQLTHVEISEVGIKEDDQLYPYEQLESFWIDVNEYGEGHLLIESTRLVLPVIALPLPPDADLSILRDVLLHFLPEDELKEPLVHKLVDHMGL